VYDWRSAAPLQQEVVQYGHVSEETGCRPQLIVELRPQKMVWRDLLYQY
jgi:hypothetical protein